MSNEPEQSAVQTAATEPQRTLLDHCIATGMSRVQAESFLGQLPNTDKERLASAAMEGSFFFCLATVRNERSRAEAVATAREARQNQHAAQASDLPGVVPALTPPGKDGDPESPE